MSANTTTLSTQDDWEVWREQFEAFARSKRIWDIIIGKTDELPEPENPEKAEKSERGPASSTRSSSITPPGNVSPKQAFKERQFKWSIYQHDLKEFEKQQKALADTKVWIQNTVKSRLQSDNCSPAESITKWYLNLEQSVGISQFLIRENAMKAYKQAIRTPKIRDIHTWLADWESAMQRGIRWKIASTSTPQEWFADFINAVAPLHPTWVESYSIAQQKAVEDESISYRTVSQDFRSRLGTALSRPKVARGSFGPTFADAEGSVKLEVDESSEGPETGKQSSKRKRGSTKTGDRPRSIPQDKRSPCKGCMQIHDWRKCFYLFPEQATEWFKPNKDIQSLVDRKLKTDKEFAEEVAEEKVRQANE